MNYNKNLTLNQHNNQSQSKIKNQTTNNDDITYHTENNEARSKNKAKQNHHPYNIT